MTRAILSVLTALAALGAVAVTVSPPAQATLWTVPLHSGSTAQARAQAAPAAPSTISATCTSALSSTIDVNWAAVAHATTYSVFQSTAAATGPYTRVTTVTGTSWTTGALVPGSYWFKVSATVGTKWTGPKSTASAKRTVVVLCT